MEAHNLCHISNSSLEGTFWEFGVSQWPNLEDDSVKDGDDWLWSLSRSSGEQLGGDS